MASNKTYLRKLAQGEHLDVIEGLLDWGRVLAFVTGSSKFFQDNIPDSLPRTQKGELRVPTGWSLGIHCETKIWWPLCPPHPNNFIAGFREDYRDFPGGDSGKEPTCQGKRSKRCGFNPWVGKILWRRAWQPTPVFPLRESHGERSLVNYSP